MLKRIAPLAYCALVLALGGCISGQVTDAVTGQPIEGATITFHDSVGNAGTVTTGQGGVYSFDGVTSPQPAAGLVEFEVSTPGYATFSGVKDVQYDDNEAQTLGVLNFILIPMRG